MSNSALYLKLLVLVTSISVLNFMLVSKVHNFPEISSYAAGLKELYAFLKLDFNCHSVICHSSLCAKHIERQAYLVL